MMTSHHDARKSEMFISTTVGIGSSRLAFMMGFITRGSTNTIRMTTLTAMRPAIISG